MRNNMIVKVTFKSGRIKVFDDVYYFYSDSNFKTIRIVIKNFDDVVFKYDDIEEIKVNEGK